MYITFFQKCLKHDWGMKKTFIFHELFESDNGLSSKNYVHRQTLKKIHF